jgi:hypothetical protein
MKHCLKCVLESKCTCDCVSCKTVEVCVTCGACPTCGSAKEKEIVYVPYPVAVPAIIPCWGYYCYRCYNYHQSGYQCMMSILEPINPYVYPYQPNNNQWGGGTLTTTCTVDWNCSNVVINGTNMGNYQDCTSNTN